MSRWISMAYLPEESNVTSIDRFLQNREEMIGVLKFNLFWAQQKRKISVDKHRSDRHFVEGEWVWLKTQTYEQMTIKKKMQSNEKYPLDICPLQIEAIIGQVAYKLKLPCTAQIHLVFLHAFRGSLQRIAHIPAFSSKRSHMGISCTFWTIVSVLNLCITLESSIFKGGGTLPS